MSGRVEAAVRCRLLTLPSVAPVPLAEYRADGGLLLVGDQVPVAPPHFFGLVAHPFVDEALVRAPRGAGAAIQRPR